MAAQNNNNNNNTRLLEDIISVPVIQGDDALIQEILEASKSEDEPTIVFEWNLDGLTQFMQKIQQLPSDAPAPPEEMVPAVSAVKAAPSGNLLIANIIANCIIQHIHKLVPGIRIVGTCCGLACTQIQFGRATSQLTRLFREPWFFRVLSSGSPLTAPLAKLYVPRPRLLDGECDAMQLEDTVLWA